MVYGLPAAGEANWATKLNDSIDAVKTTADAAYAAATIYDSGWITVAASTDTTTTYTAADGTSQLVPRFGSSSWTHYDATNAPVQVRRKGDVVEWRGAAVRTGSATANEAVVTRLVQLAPAVRNYQFSLATATAGTTAGAAKVGYDGTSATSVRWLSGATAFWPLDGIRYSALA